MSAAPVIQWLRDEMRFFSESRDAEYYAGKVKDTGGVYLVPAFTGLGAPHWDMYARGCLIGLTRGTTREHIIRAAQESIAYQVNDLLTAMKRDTGAALSSLSCGRRCQPRQLPDAVPERHFELHDSPSGHPRDDRARRVLSCRPRDRRLAAAATSSSSSGAAIRCMRPRWTMSKRRRLLTGWEKAVGRSLDWAEH